MKICIVSDFFIPHYQGGGERRYFEIGKRLVKKGYSVDVICMGIKDVPKQEEIEGINIHHIGPVIKNPPQRSSLDFLIFIVSVFRWILFHNYDLIDAQTYAPLLPSFLAAKIKRIPMLATIHDISAAEDDQWIQSSKLASIAEKILLRLPYDKIITVSQATKKSLLKYYGSKEDKIEVVYNGVDLEFIDSVKVNEKYDNTIIFVGRLAPHKHVGHLLEVVKSLQKRIPNIKLIIIGDGIEKENLLDLREKYGLKNQVKFLDNLDYAQLIAKIKKSTFLTLPSTREGLGMVIIEANACKIPAIAYATGGVREVIKDGFNGFLVEANDIESLEKKIKFLLENNSKTSTLGKNGLKMVKEKFIWDNIVEDILNIYHNL